ncbi:MAG: divergent polysaccharide deacetylase family protein, partial [Alphaproteobacteria bacterium]|nr:divergent polysaccharide deacetylase family protein [Alphaproteobacteria bacterium]
MRNFVSRPVGYLIVGSFAMIIGLSTGVGIGYFFGGAEQAVEVVEVSTPAEDDKVVSLNQPVAPLPIPIPQKLPAIEPVPDEDVWTAIPEMTKTRSVSADAPAPWPELVEKIEADRLESETAAQEKLKNELAQKLAMQAVREKDELAWAKIAEDWARQMPEDRQEEPGTRIDRESAVWEDNAVTVPDPAGKPMISIVIDDLGLNRRNTVRTIRLPGPLTLAFLTYAEDLERQTSSAHAAGHELMVHFPMEPRNPDTNPGPNALREGLSETEIRRRLTWGLSRFKGYVGINNHMGSAFTGYSKGMAVVMDEVRKRDVLFLDSLTTQASAGRKTAAQAGVPFVARDVFLDNEID